ncbi:hypothetical protein D3C81_1044270 [compost metagenome]
MKKANISNLIIVIGFLLLVFLPPLMVNRETGKISETENRFLAPFPELLNEDGKLVDGFKGGFEDWLNDNIGYRKQFVKLSSNIQYNLLHKSPSEKVQIGKDGWFFYTLDNNIEIAKGTYGINKELLENIKTTQEELQKYFDEKGIEYVLVLPTSKVSIYPEKISGGQYSVIETPVDIVSDYLRENTTIHVVDLKDQLLAEKKNRQVFFKTDTHWTEEGAYVAYRTIINDFNKSGLIDSKPVEVTLREDYRRGEFSAMMGDSELLPKEKYNATEIISQAAERVSEGEQFDRLNQMKDNLSLSNVYQYKNKTINDNKILIYGDSMFGGWNMTELLAENFSELTFAWINQGNFQNQIDKKMINDLNPDIVVLEITERYINQLGNKLNYVNLYGTLNNPKAQIISHTAPTTIKVDQTYNIDITVKNTGDEKWSEKSSIRLGIWQDGVDHGYRINIPEGTEISPGEEYTFTLSGFVAPPRDSTYLEFQMLQEGVSYFGEKERVDIQVNQ